MPQAIKSKPASQTRAQFKTGLPSLRKAASACKACDLWKHATQTVFGEGPATATIMMVGEQPGDMEDRAGHPFVGPAGKLLDQALVDRASTAPGFTSPTW